MSMVPLAGLVADMAEESVPRVPVASLDRPLAATMDDGRHVWITAILERTAVYTDQLQLPLDNAVRQLAGFRRFVVESSGLKTTERRDQQQQRRAAYNGREASKKGTKSQRLQRAADAAAREMERLQRMIDSDPKNANIGAELAQLKQQMAELTAIAAAPVRRTAGAA
jgi:hypothetical protein